MATEDTSPGLRMFEARTSIRRFYVIGGMLILTTGAVALGCAYVLGGPDSDSFRFISLLVVFIAALSATAAVFSGLQLGDRKEAFGLPSGSIRALLAVGIMILFVVFGLPLVSPTSDAGGESNPKPIAIVSQVPYSKMDDTIQRYTGQHYVVIVTSYGAPTSGEGTTSAVEHPGSLQLLPPDHFNDRLDISKQLITAIVTLLTSVVSFYFGSRSVTDSLKPGKDSDVDASDLTVRRKELAARVDTLKSELLSRGQTVDQTKALPDPASPDEITQRRTAEAAVAARRTALDGQNMAIQDLLTSVDQAIGNLTKASPADAQAVNQQAAQDGLRKLADALSTAEAVLPAYDTEIDAYKTASAAG